MKKMIAGLAIALLTMSTNVHAQNPNKKFSFGLGLEAGFPTGDVKTYYGFAPGLTLRASYKVGPGFATLTSGALVYLPKSFDGEDGKAGLQIPVKAGYKYFITKNVFVMGELGFSSFKQYYEDENGELANTSSSGFLWAPSAGVQLNSIELAFRYESVSLNGGHLNTPALRLGFNF